MHVLCVCVLCTVFLCYVWTCVHCMCVLQMPSPLFLSESLPLSLFLQLGLPKHQQEKSAGGKNKARKTLGMVNVKQIIKYGEKTTRETAHCAEAAYADQIWFASLGERDQKNKTKQKTRGKRGNCRERDGERKKGQGGTFGLWGSLAGPLSSFTSVFAFPSALIIPSPDIPMAPTARMRKHLLKKYLCWNLHKIAERLNEKHLVRDISVNR